MPADPASQRARRKTGPVTVRGEARRLTLLKAARQEFEEKGYFQTRIADIVARAGVAQGTFYSYFDSKESIFEAIATTVVGDMLVGLHPTSPPAGTPYDRARAAMERFVVSYRPNARWNALVEQVGSETPELSHLRLWVREAFVDRLERGIRKQQQIGIVDARIDPAIMADILGAMVDHVCYLWMNLGKSFDEEELIDHLTLVYTRALGFGDDPSNRTKALRATVGATTSASDDIVDEEAGQSGR